uniref:Uncharacterized protein n=1 Tax=Arundo donax TaxID=35708 RepID=A0A0A8ZMN0_ARUDO
MVRSHTEAARSRQRSQRRHNPETRNSQIPARTYPPFAQLATGNQKPRPHAPRRGIRPS